MTSVPISINEIYRQSPSWALQPTRRRGSGIIVLVLLITCLEGVVRKWLFPGSVVSHMAYLAKDVAFIGGAIVAANIVGHRYRSLAQSLLLGSALLLIPSALLGLVQMRFLGMALSLRSFVLVPWAAFLASALIRSTKDIDRIVLFVAVLTWVSAVLGCVQFYLPASHFLNRYVDAEETVVVVGGHVRAVGFFTYIAGQSFMGAVGCWAATYYFLSEQSWGQRWALGAATGVAGLVCIMTSMSRGGFVIAAGSMLLAALLHGRAKEILVIGVAATLVVLALVGPNEEPSGDVGVRGAFMNRVRQASVSEAKSYGQWGRLAYFFETASAGLSSPLGMGLGTGQRGGVHVVGLVFAGAAVIPENEIGRISYEAGWLGVLSVFMWRIVAVVTLWQALRKARDRRLRAILAASLAFFVCARGGAAFVHYANTLTWCIAAVGIGAAALVSNPVHRRMADRRVGCSVSSLPAVGPLK